MFTRLTKVNLNTLIPSVLIIVLFLIIILQRCNRTDVPIIAPKIDTITKIITIHDTVIGKPKYIKTKPDTIWQTMPEYVPDTNYPGLLKQYTDIGNKLFAQNIYKTKFPIDTFGFVTVFDTVQKNTLIGSKLISDLKIPEKIITITEQAPPKRQVYVGMALIGNPTDLLNGMQIGALYKDKKDRIFGVHVGYNGEIQYSLSSYWKLKF